MNFHQKIDSDFMWYFAFKEWVKEENHDWIVSHSFAPELWTELKSSFNLMKFVSIANESLFKITTFVYNYAQLITNAVLMKTWNMV